jgi:hypothetical protein
MNRGLWTAALAVACVALVACNGGRPSAGTARLKVDGQVQLDTSRQLLQLSSGKHTVHSGDRVKVISGSAVLERADGGTLELRRGSELRFGADPALLAGSALAVAGDDPLVVEAAGSKLSVDKGAARLTRTLAVSAASYRGSVSVDSLGQVIDVPALREVSIPGAGLVPARVSPISYADSDAWDRRYLGVAIELADQLQARSEGLTASLGAGEGHSAGFFRTVLPALSGERDFQPALLQRTRAPGETLVGATLADLGKQGTFAERWARTFSFRDDGATWGLVALDQGINDVTNLTDNLDEAIGRAPLLLAAPAPAPVAVNEVPVGPVADLNKRETVPSPTASTVTAPPPPRAVTPPVTVPSVPPVILPPPNTGTPLDPLLDPLTQTVNKLLGVL